MKIFENLVVISFLSIAFLLAVDIYDDINHGSDLTHVLLEGGALTLSIGMAMALFLQFVRKMNERQGKYKESLRQITEDRDEWKKRSEQYIAGLGRAIDEQFQKWKLSAAEKDIGLFILKGFSHKEIAELRKTSERTVRQQAASLYGKAGVENKTQLSAFFLDDLMLSDHVES